MTSIYLCLGVDWKLLVDEFLPQTYNIHTVAGDACMHAIYSCTCMHVCHMFMHLHNLLRCDEIVKGDLLVLSEIKS